MVLFPGLLSIHLLCMPPVWLKTLNGEAKQGAAPHSLSGWHKVTSEKDNQSHILNYSSVLINNSSCLNILEIKLLGNGLKISVSIKTHKIIHLSRICGVSWGLMFVLTILSFLAIDPSLSPYAHDLFLKGHSPNCVHVQNQAISQNQTS